jgi:23S rRNA (uracil1939-C5)-methyltransferase
VSAWTCPVAGTCGGCPWLGRPYNEQLEAKRAAFRAVWTGAGLPAACVADLPLASAGEWGLRDRTDLAFRRDGGRTVLGLWSLDGGELVDVGPCPALAPGLRAFVQHLARDPLPLERASLRLRVGPDGRHGLWLDAANEDLKRLLEEGQWLRRRLDEGVVVEAGQRRKPVVDEGTRLKLEKHARLEPWFQTWVSRCDAAGARPDERAQQAAPLQLFGPVGGFTQPSLAANRLLVADVVRRALEADAARWLELGAGIGNFTLPLASLAAQPVVVVENDLLAVLGLQRGARAAGLAERVEIARADLARADAELLGRLQQAEAVLADPPRSGLGRVIEALDVLPAETRPRAFVYVSCWAESLAADCADLMAVGYEPGPVTGVDQFPHTPHGEWVVSLNLTP